MSYIQASHCANVPTIESQVAQKCVAAQLERAERRLQRILAMAEGLQQKPTSLDPDLCRQAKPSRKDLCEEALRRYRYMKLPLDEAPKVSWTRPELENWLRQHPIANPGCVAALCDELEAHFRSTQDHVSTAPADDIVDPLIEQQLLNRNNQGPSQGVAHVIDMDQEVDNMMVSGGSALHSTTAATLAGRGEHANVARAVSKDDTGGNRLERTDSEKSCNKFTPYDTTVTAISPTLFDYNQATVDDSHRIKRTPVEEPPFESQLSEQSKAYADDQQCKEVMRLYDEMKSRQPELPQNQLLKRNVEGFLQREKITDPERIAFLWEKMSTQQLLLVEMNSNPQPATKGAADIPAIARAQEPLNSDQTMDESTSVEGNSSDMSFILDSNLSSAVPSWTSVSWTSHSQQTRSTNDEPAPLPKTQERQRVAQNQTKEDLVGDGKSSTSISDILLDSDSQWSPLLSFNSGSVPKNQSQAAKRIGNNSDPPELGSRISGSFATFSIGEDKQSGESVERDVVTFLEVNDDEDDLASIQNAIDTAKTVKTDAQSLMTGVLEEEENDDDDDDDDDVDGSATIVEEVAWDAPDRMESCLKVLMIPTDTPTAQSRSEMIMALEKIAHYRSKETEKVAQVLVSNGGIERLVEYARNNQNDVVVLEKIVVLLGNVASDELEARQQILSLDGIGWLLDVSRQFKNNTKIQCYAFCTLGNVVIDQPEARRQIVLLDGIGIMLDVSRQFKNNVEIQENAFLALGNLALSESKGRQQILNLNAISSLWEALQRHKHEPTLQLIGCCFLAVMTFFEEEARRRVIALNGVKFMKKMCPTLKEHSYFDEVACQCLSTMETYQDDEGRDQISKREMVRIWTDEVVERLVQTHNSIQHT